MTVYVYRNLRHGKNSRPLYSIMRHGRVIARRHRVLIGNASFVVRPAGRRRVLTEGRKNVHAFVKGELIDSRGIFGIDADGKNFPIQVRYNPKVSEHFIAQDSIPYPVKGARGVLLNEHGMTATYLEAA